MLTDDEINKAWEDSCFAAPIGEQQRFKFAKALELKMMEKLLYISYQNLKRRLYTTPEEAEQLGKDNYEYISYFRNGQ